MSDELQAIDETPVDLTDAGQSPDVDDSSSQEQPEGAEQAEKPSAAQERIRELVRERSEARREAEALRVQQEKYLQLIDRLAPQHPQIEASPDGRPLPDHYDGGLLDPQYQEDLITWKAERIVTDRLAAQQKAAEVNNRGAALQQAEADFAKTAPDYAAARSALLSDPMLAESEALGAAILEAENAPEIIYHLGKNPDLAYQIAGMSPVQAARAIGKLEAQLSAAPAVSQAPAPARGLRGGAPAAKTPAEARSMEDYIAAREKSGAHWARPSK